jgi:CRP/FNR family transcriptional regulator, anaerobic regulatory protein
MYHNHLFEFLDKIHPLDSETKNLVKDNTLVQHFPKGSILHQIDEIQDKAYFICKGLIKAYYIEHEKEVTTWVLKENDFAYLPYSFLQQKPSFEAMETIEDTIVIVFNYESLQKMYNNSSELNKVSRLIAEQYLIRYDERVRLLRLHTVEEKFIRFIRLFSDIYERTSLKDIASFLGTTAGNISRVHNKKHKNSHLQGKNEQM